MGDGWPPLKQTAAEGASTGHDPVSVDLEMCDHMAAEAMQMLDPKNGS